jgi:hypothetical protein
LTEIAAGHRDYGASVNYARRVVELRPESEAAQKALSLVARQARLHNITPISVPPATSTSEPSPSPAARLATQA